MPNWKREKEKRKRRKSREIVSPFVTYPAQVRKALENRNGARISPKGNYRVRSTIKSWEVVAGGSGGSADPPLFGKNRVVTVTS